MDERVNELSSRIIEAAINVHREIGPGLLESIYSSCMLMELKEMGIEVKSEVLLPVWYKGRRVGTEGFRLDLLVEDTVIVELKSVEQILPIHKKQLLTYLRLADKPLGLLINFNEVLLKKGLCRIINSVGA